MKPDTDDYTLGSLIPDFSSQQLARSLTFVLTQDCNLACGYCYQVGKNKNSRMTFEVAKQAVDFFLSQDFSENAAVFDFIGGEPLLETDLMDQICDYIQIEMFRRSHKWLNNYMFSIATNGVLYGTEKVQRFVQKHKGHLSVGLTIDGTKEKHDMFRKFPSGRGSYDIVAENVKLWLQQFPNAQTKVTFASDDLPFLKESIAHLWELGIKIVPANVVFEDVWKEGDDAILEQQMRQLADYAIDTGLWQTHNCSLFSDFIGRPLRPEQLTQNWCGSGQHMLAVDHQGKLYPCIRFMDYSLGGKESISVGDIYTGINYDRLRRFESLNLVAQSKQECVDCDVASGCAWCPGNNYDNSDTGSIYNRYTAICKMHKARVRANDYYFARLTQLQGGRIQNPQRSQLYMIVGDDSVPICGYPTGHQQTTRMSNDVLEQGLRFAAQNQMFPLLLQPVEGPLTVLPAGTFAWNVMSAGREEAKSADIVVYDNAVDDNRKVTLALLLLDRQNLSKMVELGEKLLRQAARSVLVVRDMHDFTPDEFATYEEGLAKLGERIQQQLSAGRPVEFNILTDSFWLSGMDNCAAGVKTFALGPNGKFYICPAFYYADPESAIGSLEDGIDQSKVATCDLKKAPLCADCRAYHCRRCVFDNQRYTGELNIPSHAQCVTSHIELRQSAQFRERMPIGTAEEYSVTYLDPLEYKLSRSR